MDFHNIETSAATLNFQIDRRINAANFPLVGRGARFDLADFAQPESANDQLSEVDPSRKDPVSASATRGRVKQKEWAHEMD